MRLCRRLVEKEHQPLTMKSITSLEDKLAQELITKTELAKRCACTTRHIDNLTASGVIQKIKLGMCSRYDWQDVVASLKAQSDRKEAV